MSHWGFNLSPIFYCVICLFVRASLEAQLVKDLPANAGDTRDVGLIPGSGRFPGEGNTVNTTVVLPGKFHGQRSLTGYSPWGLKESDRTEPLTLSHIHYDQKQKSRRKGISLEGNLFVTMLYFNLLIP